MSYANTSDCCRIAQDGWCSREVVEESNSGSKQNRRNVNADFIEEVGVQQLLDGVGAVNANGLSASGGFGLFHRTFESIGDEVDSRAGSRPAGGNVVGKDKCRAPSMIAAPALGDIESVSTGEYGTEFGCETTNVLGARLRNLKRHGIRTCGVDFDVS